MCRACVLVLAGTCWIAKVLCIGHCPRHYYHAHMYGHILLQEVDTFVVVMSTVLKHVLCCAVARVIPTMMVMHKLGSSAAMRLTF